MTEKRVALAVGAHPDDVEFLMAGTLALLGEAGFETHILTVANGSCGTTEYSREEIIRIRRAEATKAAEAMGATYHPGLVDDLMIYYEDSLVRKATAVVREVKPDIVLLPSLADYMEDHMNAARVTVTACFSRGIPNYVSDPPVDVTGQDVYLYHAQPHANRDGMRNVVTPVVFVDVTDKIVTKEDMLRCHESQKRWLDESQGMDSYLVIMRDICAEIAGMSGVPGMKYAEGWRQHNHIGLSRKDRDLLSEVLGEKAWRK